MSNQKRIYTWSFWNLLVVVTLRQSLFYITTQLAKTGRLISTSFIVIAYVHYVPNNFDDKSFVTFPINYFFFLWKEIFDNNSVESFLFVLQHMVSIVIVKIRFIRIIMTYQDKELLYYHKQNVCVFTPNISNKSIDNGFISFVVISI